MAVTIKFESGIDKISVPVKIVIDTKKEVNETFYLLLKDADDASIGVPNVMNISVFEKVDDGEY